MSTRGVTTMHDMEMQRPMRHHRATSSGEPGVARRTFDIFDFPSGSLVNMDAAIRRHERALRNRTRTREEAIQNESNIEMMQYGAATYAHAHSSEEELIAQTPRVDDAQAGGSQATGPQARRRLQTGSSQSDVFQAGNTQASGSRLTRDASKLASMQYAAAGFARLNPHRRSADDSGSSRIGGSRAGATATGSPVGGIDPRTNNNDGRHTSYSAFQAGRGALAARHGFSPPPPPPLFELAASTTPSAADPVKSVRTALGRARSKIIRRFSRKMGHSIIQPYDEIQAQASPLRPLDAVSCIETHTRGLYAPRPEPPRASRTRRHSEPLVPFTKSLMATTFTLSNIGYVLQKKLLPPKKLNFEDPVLEPDQRASIYLKCGTWQENNTNDELVISKGQAQGVLVKDLYVPLDTAALINLHGAPVDVVEIHKRYRCPCPTPYPEPVKYEIQSAKAGKVEEANEQPEETQVNRHKDVGIFLGRVKDPALIVLHTTASKPSVGREENTTFESEQQFSAYYNEPFMCEQEVKEKLTAARPVQGIRRNTTGYIDLAAFADEYDTLSAANPGPISFPPSQSLILYLYGRGWSIFRIAYKLCDMDQEFVFENMSRWYNDYRIPEHWLWDHDIFLKVLDVAQVLRRENIGIYRTSSYLPTDRDKPQHADALAGLCLYLVKMTIENYFEMRNPANRGQTKLHNNEFQRQVKRMSGVAYNSG